MPRRNFFADLLFIDHACSVGDVVPRCEATFRSVCSFVETCSFTNAKNIKFVCKNWRLPATEMRELWKRQTGTEKKDVTFRVQISTASKLLYDMFPSFSRDLFVSKEVTPDVESALEDIDLVIAASEGSSCYPADVFVEEVVNYPDSLAYTEGTTIADCEEAIKKLKPLTKSGVYAYLDELDTNSFHYVLSVLSTPLTTIKGKRVNLEKVKLMKELGLLDTTGFGEETLEVGDDGVPVKVVERIVEVPERTHYKLGITKEMAELLTARLEEKATPEEIKQWTDISDAEREKVLGNIYRSFLRMTVEGFKASLAKTNPIALADVINGRYKPSDGTDIGSFLK